MFKKFAKCLFIFKMSLHIANTTAEFADELVGQLSVFHQSKKQSYPFKRKGGKGESGESGCF